MILNRKQMFFFTSKYLLRLCAIMIIIMGSPVPKVSCSDQPDDIPLPAREVIYKAQKLMEENKFAEAAGVLEQFQENCKKLKLGEHDSKGCRHYLVDFNLGNCCLMAGNFPAAKAHYLSTVTTNPGFHSGWMNLAKCCCDMNAHAKAGDAFLKGYETAPEKTPETLYYGGVCFLTAGDNQKALGVFLQLLKLYPADVIKLEWKEALAQTYLSCDQPGNALPVIEEISEKTEGEKRKQWQEARLHLYLSLNMKKKALEYVNLLIMEYPLEPKWWKGLAHLHLRENSYGPALAALTVKGFLEPLTAQEERIAADLNMTLDVPIQAIRFYEKIAGEQFEPDMAYRIAQGYIRLHRPEDALKCVEKGLMKEKNNQRLMLLKGNLLYGLERYKEAASAFETAAQGKENPGGAWLMAGYAAWNAGDLEKSRLAFKHAAKYPKQKDPAQKALHQLELIGRPNI